MPGRNRDEENQEIQPLLPDHSHRYPRTLGQRVTGKVSRFFSSVAPVVVGTSLLNSEGLMPPLSAPLDQALPVAAVIASWEFQEFMHWLVSTKAPFSTIADEGLVSFLKKAITVSGAIIPPAVAAGAWGLLRQKLMEDAELEENSDTLILLWVLNAPFIQAILVGLPGLLMYGGIKKLITGTNPVALQEEHLQTNSVQNLLRRFPFRLVSGVMLTEFFREGFNTLGPAMVVHSSFFPVLTVLLDQFVTQPIQYYANQVRPGDNLVPDWMRDCNKTDKEAESTALAVQKPSATHKVISAGLYGAKAFSILLLFQWLNYFFMKVQTEDQDPESLDTSRRIVYETGLLALCIMMSEGLRCLTNSSSCFFNRNKQPPQPGTGALEHSSAYAADGFSVP